MARNTVIVMVLVIGAFQPGLVEAHVGTGIDLDHVSHAIELSRSPTLSKTRPSNPG